MLSKLSLVLISLTLSLSACHGSAQGESGTLYEHDDFWDGKLIDNNVAFPSQPVTSQLECLLMCMQHCTCVIFTHKVTSSGQECRGHSYSSWYGGSERVPGSRTFEARRRHRDAFLWMDCTVGNEYPMANSLCIDPGKLLCSPGYYFAVSPYACVKDCNPCALLGAYGFFGYQYHMPLSYDGYSIDGHYADRLTGLSENDCISAFVNDLMAPAASYDGIFCNIHHLTYIDVPATSRISGIPGKKYFQKKCTKTTSG